MQHPEVQYVQGMNFIAATLLEAAQDEGDALVLLERVMHDPRYHLSTLFQHQLRGMGEAGVVVTECMRRVVPGVIAHFEEQGVGWMHFMEWYMTLLTYVLPPIESREVWTLFFKHGWRGLLAPMAVLLQQLEPFLEGCDFATTVRLLKAHQCYRTTLSTTREQRGAALLMLTPEVAGRVSGLLERDGVAPCLAPPEDLVERAMEPRVFQQLPARLIDRLFREQDAIGAAAVAAAEGGAAGAAAGGAGAGSEAVHQAGTLASAALEGASRLGSDASEWMGQMLAGGWVSINGRLFGGAAAAAVEEEQEEGPGPEEDEPPAHAVPQDCDPPVVAAAPKEAAPAAASPTPSPAAGAAAKSAEEANERLPPEEEDENDPRPSAPPAEEANERLPPEEAEEEDPRPSAPPADVPAATTPADTPAGSPAGAPSAGGNAFGTTSWVFVGDE